MQGCSSVGKLVREKAQIVFIYFHPALFHICNTIVVVFPGNSNPWVRISTRKLISITWWWTAVSNERDNMMTSMPIKLVHHAHVSTCFQYIIRACTFQCQNLFSVYYRTLVSELQLSVCSNWREFQLRLLEENMENKNWFCCFPS